MKKTFNLYLAVWAVLLVLFNVLAFVSEGLPNQEKYTPMFWVGYVFITLAFIGQLVCSKIAFNAKNLQKMFYNIPLITISWTGLVVSFIVGGVCMFVPFIPYWIGAIVCAVIFGVVAISVIKSGMAANIVSSVDDKIKMQTFFIKSLTVDAEGLLSRAESAEVKAECKKVYEAVRYSDPMSHDMLAGTESQITLKFAELATAVNDNNYTAVQKAANEVIVLIEDRNRKCKLLK